jgi:hypothetical protein
MRADDLDARLLVAHAADDPAALAGLYAEAAAMSDGDAAGFYRVQAYVFALDAGLAMAADLHAALKAEGREE